MRTKFKVGDRVKVLTKAYGIAYNETGIVTKLGSGPVYLVERNTTGYPQDQYGAFDAGVWRYSFYEYELELEPKFKAGDKVRCIDATDSGGSLKIGCVYTVSDAYEDLIVLDHGAMWLNSRFELVTDQEVNNPEPTYTIGEEIYISNDFNRYLRKGVILDAVVRNGLLKVNIGGFDCYVEEERVYVREQQKGESV